jgi:hypothetical protein
MESFGPNEVRNYNHKTVLDGAFLMAQIWKTGLISKD